MKLFVGVCNSQPTIPSAFHWSWEAIEKPYPYKKVRFDDDDTIVRNNQMVREFLKSDCDVLVKMDIDQVYPKNYFTGMIPWIEKYKLIGPLIYNKWRKNKYPPLLFEKNTFPLIRTKRDFFKGVDENGFIKIPYAHTNLFYPREIIENINPPWYELKHSPDGCGHLINRDFSFIEKIKKNGYDTYINTQIEAGHLVEEPVDSITYMKWVGFSGKELN